MNSNAETDFAEARELQWTWKTPAMAQMAVAVCRLAIARGGETFSANDLTLEEHGGSGICGSIFRRLATDEVIAPVGMMADGAFHQLTVKNPGGNHVGVWRLKSYASALRLIEVHAARADARPTTLTQVELLTT